MDLAFENKKIGTQINADFQDSIKAKMFFGVYLRKSAPHETKEIFSIF
jgi:hypothetical protein